MRYYQLVESGGMVRSDDIWYRDVYLPSTFEPCHCSPCFGNYPTIDVVLERGERLNGPINGIWRTPILCCKLNIMQWMESKGLRFHAGTITLGQTKNSQYRSIVVDYECVVNSYSHGVNMKRCKCDRSYPEIANIYKTYLLRENIGSRIIFTDQYWATLYFREDVIHQAEQLGLILRETAVFSWP